MTLDSCGLPASWGFLLAPSLLPSPQALAPVSPPWRDAPSSCPSRAAVSLGSFCGLGLLFLSTIVRKPLPQKVSAGGLIYRRDTSIAPGKFHTIPTDKEPREQPGFPLSRWVALGQTLCLSEPFNHSLGNNT